MINTLTRLWPPLEKRKEELEKFYSNYFNLQFDLYKYFLDVQEGKKRGLGRFEFIPAVLSEDTILGVYEEIFGQGSVLWDCYPKGFLTRSIKKQEERPEGDYLISHYGNPLPNRLDQNFNQVKGISPFMIPKEGIIAAFRLQIEDCHIDSLGSTYFHAVDSAGNMMRMSGYNQFFSVRYCNSCNKGPYSGWRDIILY